MKGDFTRFSFDPTKHYSSVRMQQGRVQLDSDWNEQMEIQARQQQLVAGDLVGPTGAPASAPGSYQIAVPASNTITVSPGRMYVNGLLCELNALQTYDKQVDYPGAVYPTLTRFNPGNIGLIGLPGQQAQPGKDSATNTNFVYLAFLDAWQRHVGAIEDPSIVETALGGPDTATRVQNVAQIKLAPLTGDGTTAVPVPPGDWNAITASSVAQLAAVAFVPDSAGALQVGGSNGFVVFTGGFPMNAPATPTAPDFSKGFAVEAWVYVNGTGASSVPILYLADTPSANNTSVISLSATVTSGSANLVLQVGTNPVTGLGGLDVGRWTHVAASITSSGGVTLYKNGAVLTSSSVAPPPNVARSTAYLGTTSGTSVSAMSAVLAEVRVWSGSASTFAVGGPIPSRRLIGNETGLAAYYKLVQNTTSPGLVHDSSGTHLEGNVSGTGTPSWSTNAPALAAATTTSTAQYVGPENQLYRVEIHSVSFVSTTTGFTVVYKWSRDNGSIASSATLTSTTSLNLGIPARDDVLGWAVGNTIEIASPGYDLQAGTDAGTSALATLQTVVGNTLTFVVNSGTLPTGSAATVRRWDGTGSFTAPASQPAVPWTSPWSTLESGVAVQFSFQTPVFAGQAPFYVADYWLIPARVATQAIAWPVPSSGNAQPASLSPLGIKHQYAQLGKVYLTSSGTWASGTASTTAVELRNLFPSMQTAVQATGPVTFASSVTALGVLTANAGFTATGAPINLGTGGTPQPVTTGGLLTAGGGLTVSGTTTLATWPSLSTAKTVTVHCLQIMATSSGANAATMSFSNSVSGNPACILFPPSTTGGATWIRLTGMPNQGSVTSVVVTTTAISGSSVTAPSFQLIQVNLKTGGQTTLSSSVTDQHTNAWQIGTLDTTITPTGGSFTVDPTNVYVLTVVHPRGAAPGASGELNDVRITVSQNLVTSG